MQARQSVLIIDDDSVIRRSCRDIFEANGFSAVEASNGAEALLWLLRESTDLILLDLEMPAMDGRGFLEYRLWHAKIRAIPVLVMVSESDTVGLRQVLLRLGADRLLEKPLRREDILGTVRELLAKPWIPTVQPPMEVRDPRERKDARLTFTAAIRVRMPSFLDIPGSLCDLSAGGVGVYLYRRLRHGDAITVRLHLERGSVALSGLVQWAGQTPTARGYRHGIRFLDRQENVFPLHVYSFFRQRPEAPP
jgi:CheY-like chemotaxis protein